MPDCEVSEMSDESLTALGRSINLRDLGGIEAADGRVTRGGVLFRCAAMGGLSDAERRTLAALGLHTIVDLRTNSERAEHPTPWEELGCGDYWARDHEPSQGGGLSDLFADGTLTRDSAHEMMVRVYRDLPYGHLEVLQALFRRILSARGPLLFHCTSGKDRTGMAAALVLSALGAPREAIIADYLASLNFDVLASPAFRECPIERREALAPIYLVNRDYMEAMFAAIEGREGSVEAFLLQRLALEPGELTILREKLVA